MDKQSRNNYLTRFYDLYIHPMEDLLGFMVPELQRGRLTPDNLKKLHAYGKSKGERGHNYTLLFLVKHAPPQSDLYRINMHALQTNIDGILHQKNPNNYELTDAFLHYLEPGTIPYVHLTKFLNAWKEAQSDIERISAKPGIDGGPQNSSF